MPAFQATIRRFARRVIGVLALAALGVALLASSSEASTVGKQISRNCRRAQTGTISQDRLLGTKIGDRLSSGRGRDELIGRAGRDCLFAGGGADDVVARDGNIDIVSCGDGVDKARVDSNDVVRSNCERVDEPAATQQPQAPGADSCELQLENLVAPGCKVLNSDTSAATNPESIWGNVECANASRQQQVTSGGDTHPTSSGAPQGDTAFRRLTVFDGDDFYGERCELGRNESRYGIASQKGTFALYHEGDHRVTFMSTRIPASFPSQTTEWQTIMQMKQAQPSIDANGGPMLEMQLRDGHFYLENHTDTLWSAPAPTDQWVRFAFDIHYSQDASRSSVTVYVDLNGDGDAADPGEQSAPISAPLLATETDGGWGDGLAPGDPIAGHLRVGVYHDPTIPCPSGCEIDYDNVQLVNPS